MKIRILLVDDHAVLREGLRLLLSGQPDLEVVGEAAEGREAVRLAAALRPHVAIVDIAMPDLNGIEAARRTRETAPGVRVVILSMHSAPRHVLHAFQAGAAGYLLKESAGSEVVEAVRAVHAGRRYLCREISGSVVDALLARAADPESDGPLARLTAREREILQWAAEGKSNAEIAGLLGLSARTVESHRAHLMEKLGLPNLPALVKFALQHGLTTLR
jgi:DNA-binding NarL/FixJ family response regulator